jgi:hypothetical protein
MKRKLRAVLQTSTIANPKNFSIIPIPLNLKCERIGTWEGVLRGSFGYFYNPNTSHIAHEAKVEAATGFDPKSVFANRQVADI